MKKISIFWKTVIFSVSIILATVLVLFSIVSFLLPVITNKLQFQSFEYDVQTVKDDIQKNGVETENLLFIENKGVSIVVVSNDQVIYPNFLVYSIADEKLQNSDISYIDFRSSEELNSFQLSFIPVNGDSATDDIIDSQNDNNMVGIQKSDSNVFVEIIEVEYENEKYQVIVTKKIYFGVNESRILISMIFPYFIGVGIVVAIIFSLIYAKIITNKLGQLFKIMTNMKNREYEIPEENQSGDELQELENDVISLYGKLCQEMEVVKRLEEERQLFLRGVTHELKTPIMTMGVTIKSILDGVSDANDQEELLEECYQSLSEMSSLVNEILDIAKTESVKDIRICSVNDVVKNMVEAYSYLIEDNSITIDYLNDEEMKLQISNNHLSKIISNILGNAIKYSPENGIINIDVKEDSICISNTMNNSDIDINNITKAFVTNDTSNSGLQKSHGLGLYIVTSLLIQYDIEYKITVCENVFSICIYK